MASSTTRPVANTMASSVSRFKENPAASIKAAVPINDSGIVMTGITTARRLPRNRKMTTMTIATASMSVRMTSSIDALTKNAMSYLLVTVRPGGAER